jgi:hypothetical protein
MLSWKLWRTLQNPPLKHPIFRRASMGTTTSISAKTRHSPIIFPLIIVMIPIVAAQLLHINTFVMLVSLPILLVMTMIISPLLLPVIIFCFGAYIATRISHAVFMEKQNATYDLLHLPPVQIIRTDWTLATGVLYRNHAFELLNYAAQFTMFGAGVAIVITIAVFLATGYAIRLTELLNMVALLALFYTGYVQSIVVSIILGLLVPQYAANVEQNSFNAAFAYLIVQSGTYLLALLVGFSLLPSLYDRLNLVNHWADMSLMFWRFILIYGSRELTIAYLWRYLVYKLNDDTIVME